MPVYQRLINFDRMFSQLPEIPIILNDLESETEEQREANRNLITSKFTSDMVSLKPTCLCGETRSESPLALRCPKCNTLVQSTVESEIEPIVWYRKPKHIQKLFNPIILIMIKDRIKKRGFNVMQWLLDTSYNPNTRRPRLIDELQKRGIKRGYNNFVDNFYSIMEEILSVRELQLSRGEHDYLKELINTVGPEYIFTDYLPVPNKTILIIEPTNMGVFVDPKVIKAVDAIELLVSIDVDFEGRANTRLRENRLAKATMGLLDVYESTFQETIAGKTGIMRRHVFGSRTNFSFRAVITSISAPHDFDEIHIPWGVACGVFRPMIIAKLMRRGFDLNSAIGYIQTHVYKYTDLLRTIFDELIGEAGDRGIVTLMQRNPSLLPGSALRVRITVIKDNVEDQTVSTSILTVWSMNADFDGDMLNYSLSLDHELADRLEPLSSYYTNIEFTDPLELSGNFAMPKPVVSTIANWLEGDE